MASEKATTMRTAAEALVMSFNGDWSEKTLEAAMAARAPECMHAMLPKSLNLPPKSNDDWTAHFKHMVGKIGDATMTIHDVVVAPEEKRVVIYSIMDAISVVGPFHNEYTWFFTFDDHGTKIVRIDEMLDSAATKDMMARLAKAREQEGKA
ncbi:uncharacterized protein LTR77_000901 [Saxophila tyrrhenica]|uniref:SnoaL-like domain-containing protein n=1 Tax=Saxophila tyrrhenica TaxID=1690608 RepID=A0AAV9PPT4_9PEZI|nr:hypothetical protein LTR77_000901 [Saxophila tyrrhenica]